MVELYSLRNIENTNIAVHCLRSRVKVMGIKGEDTGKMGVTRIDRLLSKIMSFKYITQLSF